MNRYTLKEIINLTGLKFENTIAAKFLDYLIESPWNNEEALPSQITFITRHGQTTNARFTITDDLVKMNGVPTHGLVHPDPYYAMAQVARLWWSEPVPWQHLNLPEVHSYTHVYMAPSAYVWPGTVLGADGFGFYWHPERKQYEKFPHLGGVIIGQNVEIGSNCTIDRGSLSSTHIGSGTKIDDQVHVGHNATIGQNVMIAAQAEISGSVTIEDNAWLGPNCSIMQGVTIGEGATIGIGAVVLRDVKPHQTVVGHHRVIETKKNQLGVIR